MIGVLVSPEQHFQVDSAAHTPDAAGLPLEHQTKTRFALVCSAVLRVCVFFPQNAIKTPKMDYKFTSSLFGCCNDWWVCATACRPCSPRALPRESDWRAAAFVSKSSYKMC
jgi:hypothetical protein